MTEIIQESALQDRVGEISQFCHQNREPVFLTRGGEGDLAVMSMDTYNELEDKLKLYTQLMAGLRQFDSGETVDGEAVRTEIKHMAGRA
jgi:PHD/YefM family antitoxin component YafN of YafNO toxin-antitoxin module